MHTAHLLATATADRLTTFALLFAATFLSWAGVPAIGAAAIGAAGVLASQGTLHLWAVIVVGTLGGWLGGMLGWKIGHRIMRVGINREGRLAQRRDQALLSGERFAERWGRFVIFFVPAWVSGGLGTPFRQFVVWNFVCAALWTLAAGLGAYGLGSALSDGFSYDNVVPLLIAVAALGAIALLGLHHHRAHEKRTAPAG